MLVKEIFLNQLINEVAKLLAIVRSDLLLQDERRYYDIGKHLLIVEISLVDDMVVLKPFFEDLENLGTLLLLDLLDRSGQE